MLINYIVKFFKSLALTKISARDFLFGLVIVLLLFKVHSNHDTTGPTSLPTLSVVTKEKAKDGTEQTVIPTVTYTKPQMKEATKKVRKNLHLDGVQSVDQVVTKADLITPNLPTTLDGIKHTITDQYQDRNITLKHVYNLDTKQGQFEFHLVPDTISIVHGVRTHWFKPDEYSVHINHTNSLFNDTLGSSAMYKAPKVWLVLGPSVGARVFYQGASWQIQPSIGVSATIPVITFKKNTNDYSR